MLYLGLVAGVFAGNIAAHASGLDAFRTFVATILLFLPALAGARLLYVVSHWGAYKHKLGLIWDRNEGGQAQYGGLIVVLPLSVPLLDVLGLPFGAFWDIGGITILVGMILTRFGCLLNGCCAGRPSVKLGSMYLPNSRGVWERRVPTQYLEAAWATALLVSAITIWHRLPFPGALLLFITGGYAVGRLLLESLREHYPTARGFTLQHGISLGLVILSLTMLTTGLPN